MASDIGARDSVDETGGRQAAATRASSRTREERMTRSVGGESVGEATTSHRMEDAATVRPGLAPTPTIGAQQPEIPARTARARSTHQNATTMQRLCRPYRPSCLHHRARYASGLCGHRRFHVPPPFAHPLNPRSYECLDTARRPEPVLQELAPEARSRPPRRPTLAALGPGPAFVTMDRAVRAAPRA